MSDIPRGVQLMIASLVKMMGLDPVAMMAAVEDIRKSVHNAATDLARVRRQNTAIMAHLGIAEPTDEDQDHAGTILPKSVPGPHAAHRPNGSAA